MKTKLIVKSESKSAAGFFRAVAGPAVLTAVLFSALHARAANDQWLGTPSTDFENGANWSATTPPANDLTTDIGYFTGATNGLLQPQITASRSLNGFLFDTATGGWTVSSSSTANLVTVGGNGISTVGQSSGTNYISANLALGANQTWRVGTGGNLLFTGSITNNFNSVFNLVINSAGNTGNVIWSPGTGNKIDLSGTNTTEFLQVKTGGLLILGGDGVNAPVTTSINTVKNYGASLDALSLSGSGAIQVNSGTWNFGDIGRNGSGAGLGGTLTINGGVFSFTGARYISGAIINVNGGVFKGINGGGALVNGGRFALGNFASTAGGPVAALNITGGLVDLALANGGNLIGSATNSLVNQSGGVLQNGVSPNGGVNGGNVATFTIGAATAYINSVAYTLTGGTLISAGAIQAGGAAGAGSVNNFNFMGGTLTVSNFITANLGSSPTATVSANQTNVSVAIGTLANYGGTLSSGGGVSSANAYTNGIGRTIITGNYAVSNSAATLAVDIGGTNQASNFQVGNTNYDFVLINGTAALGGNLTANLFSGYVPASTNSFVILIATNGLSGTFTTTKNSGRVSVTGTLGSFAVLYGSTNVVLTNYSVVTPGFTFGPTNPNPSTVVTFTNTSLGAVTNWVWNFGDGSTSVTNATGANVTHAYSSAGTYAASLAISAADGVTDFYTNTVVVSAASLLPTTITAVNASQAITQNANTVLALKGHVQAAGPIYPANGETVRVTIGGITQNGTVTNSTGDFYVAFNTAGLYATNSPFTISYTYGPSPTLAPSTNSTTVLTVNPPPTPTIAVVNRSVGQGAVATLTGNVSATGPIYPAIGEIISATINGSTQNGSFTDNAGNFSINFNTTTAGLSADTSNSVSYVYGGDFNLAPATNELTTLAVYQNTSTWSGVASTNFETGGVGGNWSDYIAPLNDVVSSTAIFNLDPTDTNSVPNQPSLTTSRSIFGLRFDNGNGGWALSGTANSVLTLGTNGINAISQSSGTNTFAANLRLGGNQTWRSQGNLLFTGSISNDLGGYILRVNSAGILGNLILSPAAGHNVNLNGTNATEILVVNSGGLLVLGGDGTNAPVTTSTNEIKNFAATDVLSLGVNGAMQVNSGIWNFGDAGRNGSGAGLGGTITVNSGTLTFTGLRYVAGATINVNGGTLKAINGGGSQSNAGRFGLGNWDTGGGPVASLNITDGFVDLAQANVGNTIGQLTNALVNLSGGTMQNSVTAGGGSNGGTVTTFTIGPSGTTANLKAAFTMSGGTFISAGTILSGGSTGLGNINNFNFLGGTLATVGFNATGLGSYQFATVSGNQTDSSDNIGTLINYGGTLAPGNTNAAGRTTITGNYAVSNSLAALDINLGGTAAATVFSTNGFYDNVVVTNGSVVLDGALNVSLINGFEPVVGQSNSFVIVTATNISGTFNNLSGGRVTLIGDATRSFRVTVTATNVVLDNYITSSVQAYFTYGPTNGTSPVTVTFTNLSNGASRTNLWTFGDGGTSTSTAATVTHNYTATGTFTVSLKTGNTTGTSTYTVTNAVVVASGVPPTIGSIKPSGANFIVTGSGGSAGAGYTMLATTNLILPIAQWTTNSIGTFAADGNFTNTITPTAGAPQQFYRVRVP